MIGKTALVTGAGGFIGGHLVKSLLDQEYTVVAVDRKWPEDWHQSNDRAVNVPGTLVRGLSRRTTLAADEIYHLAADMGGIGYITSHLTSCAANVVDTIRLLELVRPGQRVFFSSSACVYPQYQQNSCNDPEIFSLKESEVHPYDPEPGYGFEKLYGEQLMKWHREERAVETRVARYHNVYGPHGDWDTGREKAPAALARKIAIAKLTGNHEIEVWGDGEQTRSFMYVDDCVEGSQRILRGDFADPLNLGTEEWITINDLAAMIAELADVEDLTVKHDLSQPQGVRGRNSDNTLIRKELGWEPSTSLWYGLERTYAWIEDQVKEKMNEK